MDSTWEYVHGRIDPGLEESMNLVESVAAREPKRLNEQEKKVLTEMGNGDSSKIVTSTDVSLDAIPSTKSYLTTIPSELLSLILSFLSPIDLVHASSTCRSLSFHARSDTLWIAHVQANVPSLTLTSHFPCASYRELYIAHDPHWFLPKYKIWFSDYFLTGKIILARFDPRRGCIEGYRLVAEKPPPTFEGWETDDEVVIHSFEPKCRLHMDQPVIQLDALSLESLMTSSGMTKASHRFNAEIPMRLQERNHHGVFSNFLLTRAVEERPNMQLWPPATIPSKYRVRNASQEAFVGLGHKPQNRSEVSEQAFRIRRWMEMNSGPNAPGLHLGEEVYTYSTLDPHLYTPTEEKPFRGIWVGDYSGHGCEFLLVHQPDNTEPFDESSVVRGEDETKEEWEERKREERVYRGSLEAIKLTGDPNVPRGEYTFIADDIGRNGFVRKANETKFKGARIVKSRGHIAARMFRNDKYIESQLIMISSNRLAQYWVGFGHISFFERVDIDRFLNPLADDPCLAPAASSSSSH